MQMLLKIGTNNTDCIKKAVHHRIKNSCHLAIFFSHLSITQLWREEHTQKFVSQVKQQGALSFIKQLACAIHKIQHQSSILNKFSCTRILANPTSLPGTLTGNSCFLLHFFFHHKLSPTVKAWFQVFLT